jgi:hypothetical protein
MPRSRFVEAGEAPFDDALLDRLRRLIALFESGAFGDTAHEVHPGLDVGTRENYLYFTLPVALNYQRKSEALWASANATYRDPKTKFVFDPEAVVVDAKKTRSALLEHKLALQPERHSGIWLTLSATLQRSYQGDPRRFLEECGWKVFEIVRLLRERKTEFPYLNGVKMANYWLYILSRFTDAQLVDRDHISIIPDVHVKRATVFLGIADETEASYAELVELRWAAGLRGSGIAPCDLHAPLWRWSRAGFSPTL